MYSGYILRLCLSKGDPNMGSEMALNAVAIKLWQRVENNLENKL
jgi:hypothetical protein